MSTGYPSIDKPWLKYYSEEAITASIPEATLYEFLLQNGKNHLHNTALNYYGRKISYQELFDNIEKTASAYSVMGIAQGDISRGFAPVFPRLFIPSTQSTSSGLLPTGLIPAWMRTRF